MKHDLPAFALLIDADNVRQDSIGPIIEEITRHARLTVRRIYGDFTSPNLASWKVKLAEHAIHPVQQYRNTIGKNASDSALIIDAMDLLHSGRFEGFCLVSSDSDFTRLATRVREDGLVVFGFGEKKAPKAFVNACDRYIYVENLLPGRMVEVAAKAKPRSSSRGKTSATPKPVATAQTSGADSETARDAVVVDDTINEPISHDGAATAFELPDSADTLLMRAYTNVADDSGWALLAHLSSYINANHPDFDPRSYGCTKFIDLLQKSGAFELVQRSYKNGQSYFCRPSADSQPRVVEASISTSNSAPIAKPANTSSPAPTPTQKPKTGKTMQTDNPDFEAGLLQALQSATTSNEWASVGAIGQKLKALGLQVRGSGHSSLTSALNATGKVDMKGSGSARYFRLAAGK